MCSELGKGLTSEAGSISSEPVMCGGVVHIILLFYLVARCLKIIDVCSGGIQPVRTGSLEPVPRQSHILRTGF